jgi:hypothetical protein
MVYKNLIQSNYEIYYKFIAMSLVITLFGVIILTKYIPLNPETSIFLSEPS